MKISNAEFNAFNEGLQSQTQHLSLGSALKKALQLFIQFFVSGSDLQIWITTDRYGNRNWHAYDPVTGRSTIQSSEADIRAWIDQRYYN